MSDVWNFSLQKLNAGINILLLYVLESEGSSPGRKGFTMAVAADNHFCGTIGGGIMEHKSVEKAKVMLASQISKTILMRQYHDKVHGSNQSGMICSGSQLNAFMLLDSSHLRTVSNISAAFADGKNISIEISPKGLQLTDTGAGLQFNSEEDWIYSETLNRQPVIHIIGAGHVALALSELMRWLGFYVKLYDDRPDLNTLAANSFAHEKHIVNYGKMEQQIKLYKSDYIVIMTVGYRTDKAVLKQLLNREVAYLGLLGSKNKIATLLDELKAEGLPQASLERIAAPVGIDISSKTTQEIAVSIAAQVILKKNQSTSW